MNNKFVSLIILILSSTLIVGTCFVLIKSVSFFITRKETVAKVASIQKASGYKIQLIYFNEKLEKEITTTIGLKITYGQKIKNFGESVDIYYSGLFPHDVYIRSCKVPKKGIIILELVMLAFMCVAFKAGFDGIRK